MRNALQIFPVNGVNVLPPVRWNIDIHRTRTVYTLHSNWFSSEGDLCNNNVLGGYFWGGIYLYSTSVRRTYPRSRRCRRSSRSGGCICRSCRGIRLSCRLVRKMRPGASRGATEMRRNGIWKQTFEIIALSPQKCEDIWYQLVVLNTFE